MSIIERIRTAIEETRRAVSYFSLRNDEKSIFIEEEKLRSKMDYGTLRTGINVCIRNNQPNDLAMILNKFGMPPEQNRDWIWDCAINGQHECLELLIPYYDTTEDDSILLRFAAERGHADCVRTLIPLSDPKAKNSLALVQAVSNSHEDVVGLLIPVSDIKAAMKQLKGDASSSALLRSVVESEKLKKKHLKSPSAVKRKGL